MKSKKTMMGKLLGSVREYKKASILTPIFMVGEVVGECLIPYFMATKSQSPTLTFRL